MTRRKKLPLDSGRDASPGEGTASLSRREREIMDAIYRRGSATVSEVQADLPDPPSYSAVRALLRILEQKGHLGHREEGPRYVYEPTVPLEQARRSAARHLLETFFADSVEGAVSALLDARAAELDDDDYERLLAKIEAARREGR
jgi:predicted transcriptional regulator